MSRGVSGCGTGLVAGRDSASPRLLTPTETKEASHARNLCSSLFRGRPGHRRIRCDGGCNSPNRSRHPSPHRLQFQHGFLIRCERNRLTLSFTVVGIAHEWLLFVVRHGVPMDRGQIGQFLEDLLKLVLGALHIMWIPAVVIVILIFAYKAMR
jgi:hypothetical protein